MKKFILKAGLFLLPLMPGFFLVFFFMAPQYTDDYNASIIDKVARLKSIDEPKIVLLGNSNLAFGIQSDIIEREIQMPVVNMGLHGGLGDPFHERMARFNIHEGDIYIYCYHSFNKPEKLNAALAWITIENYFDLYSLLAVKDIPKMTTDFLPYINKVAKKYFDKNKQDTINEIETAPEPPISYLRSSFNKYGDVAEKHYPSPQTFGGSPQIPSIDGGTIKRINKLSKYLADKRAVFLVAGFPIGYDKITETDLKKFEDFTQTISEQLECPVISNYADYLFSADLFYDTTLHLTHEGAKLRTEQLAKDILNWQRNLHTVNQ